MTVAVIAKRRKRRQYYDHAILALAQYCDKPTSRPWQPNVWPMTCRSPIIVIGVYDPNIMMTSNDCMCNDSSGNDYRRLTDPLRRQWQYQYNTSEKEAYTVTCIANDII